MKKSDVKSLVVGALGSVACCAFAVQGEIERADPAMVVKSAVVTNGVKWIDGRCLPIEGRAFDNVEHYYDRLPIDITTNVNIGVRGRRHTTSGMIFRFTTDSRNLHFRWTPYKSGYYMDNMSATAHSGIDVYRYDAAKGKWAYVKTGRTKRDGENLTASGALDIGWKPGTPCLVNLPLYNGIREFTLGIDTDATIKALPPRASGIDRPVVFYGTSITQGASCTRPGLAFVNRVGRDLDVPVVGLGFAGSGVMEFEMSDLLARIDASCYVLDCLWNMNVPIPSEGEAFHDMYAAGFDDKDRISVVRFRYEPFIRNLRAKRPGVPIVMAEQSDGFKCGRFDEKNKFIRKLYDKLVAEGWKDLVYLPNDNMYSADMEGTVDGNHPNDSGMESMAKAFGEAVRQALHL